MKPVLVLQHMSGDSPAYLGTWLGAHDVPFALCDSGAGQAFPHDLGGFGALALLGGEMSANDDVPALRQAQALIRQAVREGVPTIGHCLGGQLMARALGATVGTAPAPEIGWQPIDVLDTPAARQWLGGPGVMHVFQWHHEAFSLPPGAEALATSVSCPHQAFALGPHLAMQFHVEIDAAKIELWTRHASARDLALLGRKATTQTARRMRDEAQWRLAQHQRLAARVYARWLAGVR